MMNKTDTLGRRIQAGRRAAGLSQEALGEQLEVSRQAVSKWESDAAVPELEKLVAMSRLFGVTVGALLGVEPAEAAPGAAEGEASGTPEASPETAAEPTDRELSAALAAWWAAAERRRWPLGRKLAAAAGCALAAALLVTLGVQVFRSGERGTALESRLAALEAQVAALQAGAGQLEPAGTEGSGLLLDYDLTPTGLDAAAAAVTVRVSATPWEQAAGAVGVFTAQLSDGRRFSREAVYDRGAFTAEDWVLPLNDTIQVSVALTEGETTRTGILETLYDWGPESAGLKVDGGWSSRIKDTSVKLGQVRLEITAPSDLARQLGLAPAAAAFCLYRNQEPEPEQTLPIGEVLENFDRDTGLELGSWTGCETTVDLDIGDTVVAAIRTADNFGQVRCHPLYAWARPEASVERVYGLPEDWVPGAPIN